MGDNLLRYAICHCPTDDTIFDVDICSSIFFPADKPGIEPFEQRAKWTEGDVKSMWYVFPHETIGKLMMNLFQMPMQR